MEAKTQVRPPDGDKYKTEDIAKKLSDFPSITLKPKTLKSTWTVSKELKKILPFLFNGVVR
jgi:hypothetical protein